MFTKKPFLKRRLIPPLLGALLAASAVSWGALFPAVGRAQGCGSCTSGSGGGPAFLHCPPCYVHCTERPPRIKFKCVCPRPVCVPCDAEFWGYYPTCWRRWPAPYANCPDRNPAWLVAAAPCPGPNCLLPPHPGVVGDGAVPAPQALPAPEQPRSGAPARPISAPGQPSPLPHSTLPVYQPPVSTTASSAEPDPLLPPVVQEELVR